MNPSMRNAARLCALLLTLLFPGRSYAAQQFDGLCSVVGMRIEQELTLERVGFLATLEITNNEGDASVTDFSAGLTFEKQSSGGEWVAAAELFFVQAPILKGIDSIDGAGLIPPGQTATVQWFIIPKTDTGGTDPTGQLYRVGASLGGQIYGTDIPPESLAVLPDSITVRPDPKLKITYFQPRDVDGDDPFTPHVVESPVPFTLGVLVQNVGYGAATNLKIESQQPEIVENISDTLMIPLLLGTRVDDAPLNHASLTVDLQTIEPGQCRKGAWDMITSLSGEFVEFSASYTHATELGGEDTSVIDSIEALFIVREALNDQPGRDTLLDFLAVSDPDADIPDEGPIPDALYETDCNVLPVNHVEDVEVVEFDGLSARILMNANLEDWVYARVFDPAQGRYPIERVERSDGKVLNLRNVWTHRRYTQLGNEPLDMLNLFDFVDLGTYEYVITYGTPEVDVLPPLTTLRFSGPNDTTPEGVYITADTQLLFTVEDQSLVGTYYALDGDSFAPAYPFRVTTPGSHLLEFYSEDVAGNRETTRAQILLVSGAAPTVGAPVLTTGSFVPSGDALSVRDTEVTVTLSAGSTAGQLTGVAEVFSGVHPWPQLIGVPASPTQSGAATLTVTGTFLDVYQYRLGAGAWSEERGIDDPLTLADLSGSVSLSVRGRALSGGYLGEEAVTTVGWRVDPSAPATTITSADPWPSRGLGHSFAIGGADLYRWTVDGGYFRPEVDAMTALDLTLAEGVSTLSVIGKVGDDPWQEEDAATTLTLRTDRSFGHDLPETLLVRQDALGALEGSLSWTWDGLDDQGQPLPSGWYTVKLTLSDSLGQETTAIERVFLGSFLPEAAPLTESAAPQGEVDGGGSWVVWQDQRSGSWDVYAQDLRGGQAAISLGATPYNEERPRTDGRIAVWQARQANGSWDIWAAHLGIGAPYALTLSPGVDEIKPDVDWPWVVYQTRSVDDPGAPWQLVAYNLLTDETSTVDASAADQLDPAVEGGRVVWQDLRDAGYGEIYLGELERGGVSRLTVNTGGQYHPTIAGPWVVWADNRDGQFDLFGLNLLEGGERQLTATAENETRPWLTDRAVLYLEDSVGGVSDKNLRLRFMDTGAALQLTTSASEKSRPIKLDHALLWVDRRGGQGRILTSELPDLQVVFGDNNAVVVTPAVTAELASAFDLLTLWHGGAGITEVSRYASLVPTPVLERAYWSGGAPAGVDFALEEGQFLWVPFEGAHILDLGASECAPRDLGVGVQVLSLSCFPDGYSAYDLIASLGPERIRGVRRLVTETSRWASAEVVDGALRGDDFPIPNVAVVLVETTEEVSAWRP